MARRMLGTTVNIEGAQLARLKALSESTGVPVAVYIREGVDAVLKQNWDKIQPYNPWAQPKRSAHLLLSGLRPLLDALESSRAICCLCHARIEDDSGWYTWDLTSSEVAFAHEGCGKSQGWE